MALTAKIKLLRVLSVFQCWLAVWLLVLGIVERVRVTWVYSALGMGIWIGVWVSITGAFGVFISFKRIQTSSHSSSIPQHLVMTFMGFSLTCGILSTLFLFLYSLELSVAESKTYRAYSLYRESRGKPIGQVVQHPINFDAREKEQHALVGSIYGFAVVEIILAMWSVAICLINDQRQLITEEEPCSLGVIPNNCRLNIHNMRKCGVPLMSPANQEQGGNNSVASRFGYTQKA